MMLQEKIFASLSISKDLILNEIAILLIKQQIAEYTMEIDYFERKYGKNFAEFEKDFQQDTANYEQENDWLSWKFASESYLYWENLLQQVFQVVTA